MHRDEYADTGPLDPSRDPARWASLIGGTLAAAEGELARRRARPAVDPFLLLGAWHRPALAAAAVLAMLACGSLAVATRGEAAVPAGVADSLGYPAAISFWIELDRPTSVEELVASMEPTP